MMALELGWLDHVVWYGAAPEAARTHSRGPTVRVHRHSKRRRVAEGSPPPATATAPAPATAGTAPKGSACVGLDELRDVVMARLRWLQALEEARRGTAGARQTVADLLGQARPGCPTTVSALHDQIGHHTLRLALAGTGAGDGVDEGSAAEFVASAEAHLFGERLVRCSDVAAAAVIARAGLHGTLMVGDANARLLKLRPVHHRADGGLELQARCCRHLRAHQSRPMDVARAWLGCRQAGIDPNTVFLAVRFEACPELLHCAKTRPHVHHGFVLAPLTRLPAILARCFRRHLLREMAVARRQRPVVLAREEERLAPLFQGVAHAFGVWFDEHRKVTTLPAGSDRQLERDDVDEQAHQFPLCMATIHSQLREDHRLKHEGRLVYTLFLKGLGMTVQDAVVFFLSEYEQAMTREEIRKKQYRYSIRHLYGLEGSRIDRAPYGCAKIISDYTCPFKAWPEPVLLDNLENFGVEGHMARAAVSAAKEGRFQVACKTVFLAKSPAPAPSGPARPGAASGGYLFATPVDYAVTLQAEVDAAVCAAATAAEDGEEREGLGRAADPSSGFASSSSSADEGDGMG